MQNPTRDVTVHAEVATAKIEALPASVHVGPSPFWLFWAQIAVEHRDAALAARKTKAVMDETKAAMISLTAATFAIDSFCLTFEPHMPKPAPSSTGTCCKPPMGERPELIWEQLGYMTASRKPAWRPKLNRLFRKRRNFAIHYRPKDKRNVRHPTGFQVSHEIAAFTAGDCTTATQLVVEIFAACTTNPTPSIAKDVAPFALHVAELRRAII